VYTSVPRTELIDALIHIRALYRQVRPTNDREQRAQERLEVTIKDLLSNLPRTNEHPTLKTLLEVAEIYSLTLDGAHRLFGYDLDRLWEYDLQLNRGRTHIFESYSFSRDRLIDLPSRLAPFETFSTDALLNDLVSEWHTDLPMRVLEGDGWHRPGTFYVHIGTEDSLGSSVPPGAIAQVEPVGRDEALRPNPRRMYLLQFGNGYRCSRCVATAGKLRLFSSARTYRGREEFIYPGGVRLAGRVRLFAMSLPLPEYSLLDTLPDYTRSADLILPWEHLSRDRLFATKHRRFLRSQNEQLIVQEFLNNALNAKLSARSERRYRRATSSEPHVNGLIHLTLAHAARYTDALRTDGSLFSDKGRFSLETLLKANSLQESLNLQSHVSPPTPREVWEARRKEVTEWPPLLSMQFPRLRHLGDRIVRLAKGSAIHGLDPEIGAGSWMLLENIRETPDTHSDRRKIGWSRPIYVLRRGIEIFSGYLEKYENRYALLGSTTGSEVKVTFEADELPQLNRVAGIAIPV
jgi:hypothetical protein